MLSVSIFQTQTCISRFESTQNYADAYFFSSRVLLMTLFSSISTRPWFIYASMLKNQMAYVPVSTWGYYVYKWRGITLKQML